MNRFLAVVIVVVIALSLLRTRGAEPTEPADDSGSRETDAAPSASTAAATAPAPTKDGALLRLELQAELPWNALGPPLELRLRAADGAARPFDVTVREPQTRQKLSLQVSLPVARPELPLRCELLGDEWCIPPGSREFRIPRMDAPYRLVLVRARVLEVQVVADASGEPIGGAQLVHESGARLATTAIDGRARLVRPRNPDPRREELVLARASGFLPGALDEAGGEASPATLRLRASARAGVVRGQVVDARRTAIAGVLVTPRYEPAGSTPDDAAARALFRWLAASAARELPLLTVTSDAEGRFELPAPWPGRLVVSARARENEAIGAIGRVSATLANESRFAEDGRVTELELRFPPVFELRVTARRDGRPLANAAFELVQREGSSPLAISAAISDREGAAALRAPAVSPLWLVARAEGAAPQVIELAPDPARGNDVAIDFAPGRRVTFVVTGAESLELAQRVVAWRDAASQLLLGEAPLAHDGRVKLDHLPIGRKLEFFVATGGEQGTRLRAIELERAPAGDSSPLDLGALALPHD